MNEFVWGASTSAHQVEGNNIHNDWWQWEQSHPDFPSSGKACDHFNTFEDDFALAKSLGHTAHRLSLEWSRLEVKPGEWNQRAVAHYRRVLEALKKTGLKSFVTLHHFTNPQWIANAGGWDNPKTAQLFARYARFAAQQFGDLVDSWVTINEPMVYATMSYTRGLWPPQKKSIRQTLRVISNLVNGHEQAYHAIHGVLPETHVSIAKHLVAYLPEHKEQADDQLVASLEDWWFNHRFLNRVQNTLDFIGVNYYFTRRVRVHIVPPTIGQVPWEGPVSDLDWPIRPEGLTHVLLHMKRYKKPIYVTENGLADANDSRRADFIRGHIRAIEAAQKEGVDIRGYFHWSLLDNFEWAEGFKPRFGLVEVDYETQQRTPRPSAYTYRAIIEQASSSKL